MNSVVTYGVLGVECVELTCAGCRFNPIATEYFCHGIDRYIDFRCESQSAQLDWDVSPLFKEPVNLGTLSNVDNIIHNNGVDIIVGTVDQHNVSIVSNLLLNLGALTSDVTVSCGNGHTKSKTFKIIGML